MLPTFFCSFFLFYFLFLFCSWILLLIRNRKETLIEQSRKYFLGFFSQPNFFTDHKSGIFSYSFTQNSLSLFFLLFVFPTFFLDFYFHSCLNVKPQEKKPTNQKIPEWIIEKCEWGERGKLELFLFLPRLETWSMFLPMCVTDGGSIFFFASLPLSGVCFWVKNENKSVK